MNEQTLGSMPKKRIDRNINGTFSSEIFTTCFQYVYLRIMCIPGFFLSSPLVLLFFYSVGVSRRILFIKKLIYTDEVGRFRFGVDTKLSAFIFCNKYRKKLTRHASSANYKIPNMFYSLFHAELGILNLRELLWHKRFFYLKQYTLPQKKLRLKE